MHIFWMNGWVYTVYWYWCYLLWFPLVVFSSLVPCEEKNIKTKTGLTVSEHLADDAVEMVEVFPLQEAQPHSTHRQLGHLGGKVRDGFGLFCLCLLWPGLNPCRQRWRRWGFLAINWSSWWPWGWAPVCRSRVPLCECGPSGWGSEHTRISRQCPSQWTACCTAPSAPSRRCWPSPCYCWWIARPPSLVVFSLSSLELSGLSDLI